VRSAVARRIRTRRIYAFDILERSGRDVLFRMACEAGTYVRVACHEIGRDVGGANMKELRRTKAGAFTEEHCVKMQDLVDAYYYWKNNGDERIRDYVLPVEAGIEHTPKIIVKDSAVFSIASGSAVYTGGISKASKSIAAGQLVAVLTLHGELVALAQAAMTAEDMMKKKGLAAKTDRVVIDKALYPKA
jgi:H/ACA ribonucleoprotein complex subunit 4